ncbi:hypothetical protein [Winogradskyella sp. PG-2]|nr:hypothetical protein [Winogradskyella sp. PG-2]BAO75311.1 hypothetical protein WPG_1081 [Winogradskyella sp. PG-2]
MKSLTKKLIDVFFWLLKWAVIIIIAIAIIYIGWWSYGGIEL